MNSSVLRQVVGIPIVINQSNLTNKFQEIIDEISNSTCIAYVTTDPQTLMRMYPAGMQLIESKGIKFINESNSFNLGDIFNATSVWIDNISKNRESSVNTVFDKLESFVSGHLIRFQVSKIILLRPGSPNICDDLAKKWISSFSNLEIIEGTSPIHFVAERALVEYAKIGLNPKTYEIISSYKIIKGNCSPKENELLIITSVQIGYNTFEFKCVFCKTIETLKTAYPIETFVYFLSYQTSGVEVIQTNLINAYKYCEFISKNKKFFSIAIYNE